MKKKLMMMLMEKIFKYNNRSSDDDGEGEHSILVCEWEKKCFAHVKFYKYTRNKYIYVV